MNKPTRLSNTLLKMINSSIVDLPSPSNLSLWWNMGSLLGLTLITQMITGIMLTMHYQPNSQEAFGSIIHLMNEVNQGWLIRYVHANGASLFFIFMYLHVGRGIYYKSYKMTNTWFTGILILIMSMGTAFLGYVLPWGQMSFWGATVITNLLSTIPYLGSDLIHWLWGGFSIENPTLTRFFTLHFLLPFIVLTLSIIHLFLLHLTGSNNPMGLKNKIDKIPFHPFFSGKDILGFTLILMLFIPLNLIYPLMTNDPENYLLANPLVTPIHIQPEWYFLFAYSILRSVPSKLGGVVAMSSAILILLFLPLSGKPKFMSSQFYPANQLLYWTFVTNVLLLTWLGMSPVEPPFIILGQILTCSHFTYFIFNPIIEQWWDWSLD